MGIVDNIRNEAKKSSANKGKILFFKDGTKSRIRFLTDMEDAVEILFHDSFEKSINTPCRELFGESCPYCDDEELRSRNKYAFCVYDYESKEVKILLEAVNSFSPLPQLLAMYDSYGTLLDRDYIIQQTGKGQSKSFAVIPQDKKAFRDPKAKAYSEQKILQILQKAYPEDGEEEEEKTTKKSKKGARKAPMNPPEEDWNEEEKEDYSEYTAVQLYKMCKERDIECKPRKNAQYYINLLEEDDKATEDWGEEEDEEFEED